MSFQVQLLDIRDLDGAPLRAQALSQLMILAGLRSLGSFVEEESRRMPILTDVMDHDFIGPLLRKGMAAGRVEGERTFFLNLANALARCPLG